MYDDAGDRVQYAQCVQRTNYLEKTPTVRRRMNECNIYCYILNARQAEHVLLKHVQIKN